MEDMRSRINRIIDEALAKYQALADAPADDDDDQLTDSDQCDLDTDDESGPAACRLPRRKPLEQRSRPA